MFWSKFEKITKFTFFQIVEDYLIQFCVGHLGWCNGLQARLANLHKWVKVSLGPSFIWPCVTFEQNT